MEGEYDILLQDGGLATVHDNGECTILSLYQNRTHQNPDEGKVYIKEFPYETLRQDIINYALDWLAPHAQKQFTYVK